MDFEFLEFTSDVMFRAYGKSVEELFINAAKAMFTVICDIERVEAKRRVEIEVSASNLEELLFEWLSKLLTESEIEGLFFSTFSIDGIDRGDDVLCLRGWAAGEDAEVEKGGTLVKGVTYYGLKVERSDEGYAATVSLDI